jgi:group I intron endonuclease
VRKRFTIYCHTCRVSGKKYVGMTSTTMDQRWLRHVAESRKQKSGCWAFHAAIRKHGVDAFGHEILDVVYTEDGAKRAERAWIAHLNCRLPNGYNVLAGGELDSRTMSAEALRERAFKSANSQTPEERSEKARRGAASQTPEQRREKALKRWRNATPEQLAAWKGPRGPSDMAKARARQRWAKVSAEDRRKHMAPAQAANDPEAIGRRVAAWWSTRVGEERNPHAGLSEEQKKRAYERVSAAKKAWWASRTPEQRKAVGQKMAATRRARARGDES